MFSSIFILDFLLASFGPFKAHLGRQLIGTCQLDIFHRDNSRRLNLLCGRLKKPTDQVSTK
jgi:hypothetical protein